jgi:FkbM family methyltransferase
MRSIAELVRHASRAPEILEAVRVSPNWPGFILGYLALRTPAFPFEMRLRSGRRLMLADHDEIAVAWHVCVRRCYRIEPTDRVILDAGANVGVFAIHAAEIAPRAKIFCFEPFPATYRRLVRHIEDSGLGDRVTALPYGLAGHEGTRLMSSGGFASPNVRLLLAGDATGSEIPVECRSIARVLDDLGLDEVDYLKMDIEGAEHEVLLETPPEVLARIKRMDIEVHEVNEALGYTPERLFAHLKAAGQKLVDWAPNETHTGIAQFDRVSP